MWLNQSSHLLPGSNQTEARAIFVTYTNGTYHGVGSIRRVGNCAYHMERRALPDTKRMLLICNMSLASVYNLVDVKVTVRVIDPD